MRDILKNLIKDAIVFEYELPNTEKNILSSKYSTIQDKCYSNDNYIKVSELIYNSIVDYANNSYEIDYENLDREQIKTIITKLRYEEDAEEKNKQKYGFYGEVLLYCILSYFFGTDVIIAKGNFYNILDGSEPKGYDCFHLIEKDNGIELWFGEAKCYRDYKGAIRDVLNKIENAISDNYLNKNFIALIKEKDNFDIRESKVKEICERWEENPTPNVLEEIKKYNMKLIYPILIVSDKNNKAYDEHIKDCINFIQEEYDKRNISFNNTFMCDIFFAFLPINNIKEMKGQVIKWISEKKQLRF